MVKDRGKVMVWVYVSANHWLDCAYLSMAATLCTDEVSDGIQAGEAPALMHGPT